MSGRKADRQKGTTLSLIHILLRLIKLDDASQREHHPIRPCTIDEPVTVALVEIAFLLLRDLLSGIPPSRHAGGMILARLYFQAGENLRSTRLSILHGAIEAVSLLAPLVSISSSWVASLKGIVHSNERGPGRRSSLFFYDTHSGDAGSTLFGKVWSFDRQAVWLILLRVYPILLLRRACCMAGSVTLQ